MPDTKSSPRLETRTDYCAPCTRDPDLVVVDVRMPPSFSDEGARAATEIKQTYPRVGVLVLSQHIETTHAITLVTLGGFGYLFKDRVLDVDEFLAAAQRVAEGGSALDPQVVASLISLPDQKDTLAGPTDREREVLKLMAQGLTNTGVARRLFLVSAPSGPRPQPTNEARHTHRRKWPQARPRCTRPPKRHRAH
jgi:DNA-binding NarL/FixJ family response regulator